MVAFHCSTAPPLLLIGTYILIRMATKLGHMKQLLGLDITITLERHLLRVFWRLPLDKKESYGGTNI